MIKPVVKQRAANNRREAFIEAFDTAVTLLSPEDAHTYKRQVYCMNFLKRNGTTPDSHSDDLQNAENLRDLLLELHCKLG